jgi:hypothetical protein
MAAILSPLQLQAGSALFQNQGIEISFNVTTEIADYYIAFVGKFIATINAKCTADQHTNIITNICR